MHLLCPKKPKQRLKRRNSLQRVTPLEDDDLKALFEWASYSPILRDYMWHPFNEGGYRHVAKGLLKGVSDIVIDYPVYPYHGMYLELKKVNGKNSDVSDEQWQFIYNRRRVGFCADVAFGFDDAKDKISAYLKGI
jgi:hypothetical protein